MPKKQVSQDRKARVAEMQRVEKARENRVRIRIIAGAAALLLVLGVVIAYAVKDAGKQRPDALIATIGVPASATVSPAAKRRSCPISRNAATCSASSGVRGMVVRSPAIDSIEMSLDREPRK